MVSFSTFYRADCSIGSSRFANQLRHERERDAGLAELRLERDPWDRYALLDADYYLPILINNLFLGVDEQILIVHFVLFMVSTDQISHFDLPQEQLIASYLEFCKAQTNFLNNKNALDYLRFVRENGLDEPQIEANLEYLAQNFFDDMKREGRILAFKKDYFN